jgi:hypothetical protein
MLRIINTEQKSKPLINFISSSLDSEKTEKLLVRSLKYAECQGAIVDDSISEILESLINLYESQNRKVEASLMRRRLARMSDYDY